MSFFSVEKACSFLLALEALEKQPYDHDNETSQDAYTTSLSKGPTYTPFLLNCNRANFFVTVTVELPKTSAQKLAKDAYPYLVWVPLLKRLTLHLASAAGKLTIQAKALP